MSLRYSLLLFIFVCIQVQLSLNIVKKKAQYDLKLAPILFSNFVATYNKTYTGEERQRKYKIFYDNLQRINAINRNFPGDWVAIITSFADLNYLEFVKMKNLTKEQYEVVNETVPRNVINCTDRRAYLFERFATEPPQEIEYYSSSEEASDT